MIGDSGSDGPPLSEHPFAQPEEPMTEPTDDRLAEIEGLASQLWDALGIQREWLTAPVLMYDDPIWKMTAKEGYLFDDAFWEIFERLPLRICHVSYSGAPWSHEGDRPPVMVLRFTVARARLGGSEYAP